MRHTRRKRRESEAFRTLMSEHQYTILLVDDDQAVLEVLQEYLLLQGFRVLVSENGREALRELKSGQVDLDDAALDYRLSRQKRQ